MKFALVPWGDFNLIRFSHERKCINARYRKMVSFGNFINRWRLIDCPLRGEKYTWSNFQDCPSLSRLDCFLFCSE